MERAYYKYYLVQSGKGLDDIGPLLHSVVPYQRGRGLGSFFGGLFRYLKPIFTSGANILKKEVINSGINALSDIATGANLKEVVQDRSKEIIKNVRRGAVQKLNEMYGQGKIKRRKPIKRPLINNLNYFSSKRRRVSNKKKQKDIFG